MPTRAYNHLDERQFQLAVRRLADSLGSGADVSPFVGSGVEYAQSRPYQAGDPTRYIDWRMTARTGKPYVKEYEAHRRMNLYLLLDDSHSMRVSSTSRSKYDWAVLLTGALALAGLRRLNPVALFGCSRQDASARPVRYQPSLSRQQVHQWLDGLRDIAPSGVRTTELSEAMRDIDLAATERSIVLVLSDLHERDAIAALKRLAQRHDVCVLRLTDPAESVPIRGGIFRGQEAESGQRFVASGRQGFLHHADVMQSLRRAGVDVMSLSTNENFVPALRMFLKQRGRKASS